MNTSTLAPVDDRQLHRLLAVAGSEDATRRGGGCAQPVRLKGRKDLVDTRTGETRKVYDSADELNGTTYVRCGNRRAAVCPSCSRVEGRRVASAVVRAGRRQGCP